MKIIKILLIIFLSFILIVSGINLYIIRDNSNIYSENEINDNYDMSLVLGCGLAKDGSPSKMLTDRLNTAITLYNRKIVKKILISGDDEKNYSEVNAMEKFLVENGINSEDIIRDNKGFSTGESLINFQKNYPHQSILIVTQKYHMYRALYIAKKLNIKSNGVYAKKVDYSGQIIREIREILARCKDFIKFL